MSNKQTLIEALIEGWISNYQAQQIVHSSSGDRTLRNIRQNPPKGYHMIQRPKEEFEGYNKCLEYRLVED